MLVCREAAVNARRVRGRLCAARERRDGMEHDEPPRKRMARGPLASGERRIATNEWFVSVAQVDSVLPADGGVLNAVAPKVLRFPSAQPSSTTANVCVRTLIE